MSEKEVVANFKKRSGWVDSMNVNDSRNVPLIFQDLDTIGRCPVINGEKI